MEAEAELIALSCVCSFGTQEFLKVGITDLHFTEPTYAEMYKWIIEQYKLGRVVSKQTLKAQFVSFRYVHVTEEDIPVVIDILIDTKMRKDAVEIIDAFIRQGNEDQVILQSLEALQHKLTEIINQKARTQIVDAFSTEALKRMYSDQKSRKKGELMGIPTGMVRVDRVAGGLGKQELCAIIGRQGKGKSWLCLLCIKEALKNGYKVLYFPLEMKYTDVMYRLQTLLSKELPDAEIFRNTDLMKGKVNTKNYKKFLKALQERFQHQLLVLDIGTMTENFTPMQIDAAVQTYKPDLVVVDYLTLLRTDQGRLVEDYQMIRQLSSDLKLVAVKHDIPVVIAAQVNRDSMRGARGADVFLPRLEHISFGDALGADSDKVISLNRDLDTLYYGLVKNRSGKEFGRTAMVFDPEVGMLEDQDEEDEAPRDGAPW